MKEIDELRKELRNELKEEMQKLRDEILRKYEKPKEVEELIPVKKEEIIFDEEFAENLLKALANKERLKILKDLYRSAKYFSELQESTELDNSPLRFHLSNLKETGFIDQERYRGKYLITTQGKIAVRVIDFLCSKCEVEK
ncbi:MAG: winged helix-turn-helix transcriptional regulator [Methanomicrobia archaeon]|nr:winged helix-turn-helix transcriptional regulator [Methanomicrobia archaeon]HDM22652.1 ArsR family transcriptional regulator [Methanomicrobia archaeon]